MCETTCNNGPSPHTWGLLNNGTHLLGHERSIPTYVGFTMGEQKHMTAEEVHPHIRGVYGAPAMRRSTTCGPSPHTWGLPPHTIHIRRVGRSIPTYVGFTSHFVPGRFRTPVHPHIRGVYTEIKSKISRASSKTALLPAEKFKILFLVKIKSSAAAFQVHTIFRDQFPPGLHFEIALHL